MMSKYVKTIMEISIHREDESPNFGAGVTSVRIEDEGAGPFLVLTQRNDCNEVRFDFDEVPLLKEVMQELIEQVNPRCNK
jgi:hypothetical protein